MDLMDIRRGLLMQMKSGGLPAGIKAMTTGVATIAAQTSSFEITTNLGYVPDYFLISIDIDDYAKIPGGTVVDEMFERFRYPNIPNQTTNYYGFRYDYKHLTSLNYLSGNYQVSGTIATENSFTVQRGGSDWLPNDTDGNPLQYRWVAIKLDI